MPESSATIRVLLLADSHLGFDLPIRPRVSRRRRGYDFLANHERALAPAKSGGVDLVVHGGDIFHRPKVPPSLVFQAFQPLVEIASTGVPVFVVPGNHERARIPHDRLAAHPNLHIFRHPDTVVVETRWGTLAVSGFPYRRRIRERFPEMLRETGWDREEADLRLLCMHHCVEGATVGPADYTFRNAADVVRCADLPAGFAAVLSGHIHRYQILREDLQGRRMPTPVLYPGSVERTAFAERNEEKGFVLLDLKPDRAGGEVLRHEFVDLPARPMLVRDLHPKVASEGCWPPGDLEMALRSASDAVPNNAVLRVRVHGQVPIDARTAVAAARLRQTAPPEMNVEVMLVEEQPSRRVGQRSGRGRPFHTAPKGVGSTTEDLDQLSITLD